MIIYVDIDGTICTLNNSDGENKDQSFDPAGYEDAQPIYENIDKINKLYDEGHHIKYWTARGAVTGLEWYDITKNQLDSWKCRYHELSVGEKPDYDLLICDKTKRIEEI